jgi:uncharacterized protein with GYD domain
MRLRTIILASAVVIGLVLPAAAQQSMHRFLLLFSYTDTAVKAMTENPQNRSAQAAKLFETFGGKVLEAYFIPYGSHYDGMIIAELPDDVSVDAVNLFARASGNFGQGATVPLLTADEFKAAMEKAKNAKTSTSYTAPTATKQ